MSIEKRAERFGVLLGVWSHVRDDRPKAGEVMEKRHQQAALAEVSTHAVDHERKQLLCDASPVIDRYRCVNTVDK